MDVNVSLPDDMAAFVEAKVSNGDYGSPSQIIAEALRLLDALDSANPTNVGLLRAAWDEGIASGDAGEIDFAILKAEVRKRLTDAAKT